MKNKILHLLKRRIADLEFYINNRHNDATCMLLHDAWKHAKTTYKSLEKEIISESNDVHIQNIIVTKLQTIYEQEFKQHRLNPDELIHFYVYTDCKLLIKDIKKL